MDMDAESMKLRQQKLIHQLDLINKLVRWTDRKYAFFLFILILAINLKGYRNLLDVDLMLTQPNWI